MACAVMFEVCLGQVELADKYRPPSSLIEPAWQAQVL
jgi:hypothetical protein